MNIFLSNMPIVTLFCCLVSCGGQAGSFVSSFSEGNVPPNSLTPATVADYCTSFCDFEKRCSDLSEQPETQCVALCEHDDTPTNIRYYHADSFERMIKCYRSASCDAADCSYARFETLLDFKLDQISDIQALDQQIHDYLKQNTAYQQCYQELEHCAKEDKLSLLDDYWDWCISVFWLNESGRRMVQACYGAENCEEREICLESVL